METSKMRAGVKNTNQDHYCGALPKSIDAYIAAQPEDVQPLLTERSIDER